MIEQRWLMADVDEKLDVLNTTRKECTSFLQNEDTSISPRENFSRSLSKVFIIRDLRQAFWKGKSRLAGGVLSILDVIYLTSPQRTSNAHDRIYALLGLAPVEEQEYITLNYDAPVTKVFQETIGATLRTGMFRYYISQFAYQDPGRKQQAIPSWVPDLTRKAEVDRHSLRCHTLDLSYKSLEISSDGNFIFLPCIMLDGIKEVWKLDNERSIELKTIRTTLQAAVQAGKRHSLTEEDNTNPEQLLFSGKLVQNLLGREICLNPSRELLKALLLGCVSWFASGTERDNFMFAWEA
jgi:hypothetical protein